MDSILFASQYQKLSEMDSDMKGKAKTKIGYLTKEFSLWLIFIKRRSRERGQSGIIPFPENGYRKAAVIRLLKQRSAPIGSTAAKIPITQKADNAYDRLLKS